MTTKREEIVRETPAGVEPGAPNDEARGGSGGPAGDGRELPEDSPRLGAASQTLEKSRIRADHRTAGSWLLLYVAALAVGAILLFRPRPVVPRFSPGLIVHAPAYEHGIHGTNSAPEAAALRALFSRAATAEAAATAGPLLTDQRSLGEDLRQAVAAFKGAHGAEAVEALRSSMVHEIVQTAIAAARRRKHGDASVVGAFSQHLIRYGVLRDFRLAAPPTVVIALATVRWNAMAGMPALDGLDQNTLQYYWGWLAFHANSAEASRRLAALDAFEAAGGSPSAELRAMLWGRQGALIEAAGLMNKAHEATGNLRLRNHALAFVQHASNSDPTQPFER